MKSKEDPTKEQLRKYYLKAQQVICCAFFLFFKEKNEALHVNIT
jgi:hypothetical protein